MTTKGHLLNGRVTYLQPEAGFRSGIEPVLLAAATPAGPGEHILEAGTGAGATLLCLSARLPGVHCVGVEADQAVAELAMVNAASNGFTGMEVVPGRIEDVAIDRDFNHAIANPPYHASDGTPSPIPRREAAKRGLPNLLTDWVKWLADHLRPRGTLTLILPAGLLPTCLVAMTEAHCACSVIFPLWPKAGRPAKLIMVRGIKNSRMPIQLASGLILHQHDGTYTDATQSILRDGAALALSGQEGR